jgi:hypothetical protein
MHAVKLEKNPRAENVKIRGFLPGRNAAFMRQRERTIECPVATNFMDCGGKRSATPLWKL